jgi:peptidyl-prolyl cis-trans isomerase C
MTLDEPLAFGLGRDWKQPARATIVYRCHGRWQGRSGKMPFNWIHKLALGWALVAFCVSPPQAVAAGPVSVEIPAAQVNRTAISRGDLQRELDSALAQYAAQGRTFTGDGLAGLKKEVLENLIDRQLLLQTAGQKRIGIKKAWVAAKIEQLKSSFSSQAEYAAALARQGLTEEQIRSQVQEGLKIQRLLEIEVLQNVTVSSSEIRRYYERNLDLFIRPEQVRARHILIKVDAQASEQQKAAAYQRIQQLQSRIEAGEDFAALAIEFSQCPSSLRGGDLGYFSKDQVVEAFGEAAFSLAKGQISPIVESRLGYHLIQVLDRRPSRPYALEDVRDIIKATLRQKKEAAAVAQYLRQLRSQADIQLYGPG